jgi:hypothetical protein
MGLDLRDGVAFLHLGFLSPAVWYAKGKPCGRGFIK